MIFNEDCMLGLDKLGENTIDVCITDPPYNYEFVGHKWDQEEIERRIKRTQNSSTLVKHIPYGSGLAGGVRNKRWYERNAQNIKDYRQWISEWGEKVFRALKPGGFILVFNSTRTIAHVQVALEDVGFYARDILVWRRNGGIPKGINLSKKLKKDGLDNAVEWKGWHSALRNEWEGIALLQKPLEDNYLSTVTKWGVGVLNAENPEGGFQSNILENIRREHKESFNVHCTVKPLALIKRLIQLTIPLNNTERIVLDPFMGSGTTAIAALECGVSYVGFEIFEQYCQVAEKRIASYLSKSRQKELF